MVQKVAVSRQFEARLCYAATGKLSLSTQQKMGTFFELGKAKAAKGEGWASLSSAVPKIQWDSNPTAPTAIRLWETFTFFTCFCNHLPFSFHIWYMMSL